VSEVILGYLVSSLQLHFIILIVNVFNYAILVVSFCFCGVLTIYLVVGLLVL
jgi:hypothetical protein